LAQSKPNLSYAPYAFTNMYLNYKTTRQKGKNQLHCLFNEWSMQCNAALLQFLKTWR